jgi:hypothetical protein
MANVINALFIIVRSVVGNDIIAGWDQKITPQFPRLSFANLADWLNNSPEGIELKKKMADTLGLYIACNLGQFNDMVGKWRNGGGNSVTLLCICYGEECCREDECANINALERRMERREHMSFERDSNVANAAQGNAQDYDWKAVRNGVAYTGIYTSLAVCMYEKNRPHGYADGLFSTRDQKTSTMTTGCGSMSLQQA